MWNTRRQAPALHPFESIFLLAACRPGATHAAPHLHMSLPPHSTLPRPQSNTLQSLLQPPGRVAPRARIAQSPHTLSNGVGAKPQLLQKKSNAEADALINSRLLSHRLSYSRHFRDSTAATSQTSPPGSPTPPTVTRSATKSFNAMAPFQQVITRGAAPPVKLYR